MSPLWRRRHEIALLALMIIAAGFIGFWFGRMSAPNAAMEFERGKAEGAALERARRDHQEIDFEALKGELSAARAASQSRSGSPESSTDAVPSDTSKATAAPGTNNR